MSMAFNYKFTVKKNIKRLRFDRIMVMSLWLRFFDPSYIFRTQERHRFIDRPWLDRLLAALQYVMYFRFVNNVIFSYAYRSWQDVATRDRSTRPICSSHCSVVNGRTRTMQRLLGSQFATRYTALDSF